MSSTPPHSPVQTDRNLLFGVLALQADLLDAQQFAQACTAWSACKHVALADLLVERGVLTADDRRDVERLLHRKLKKHSDDVHASLAACFQKPTSRLLAGVADPDLQHSLSICMEDQPNGLSGAGRVVPSTTNYQPESRERYTLSLSCRAKNRPPGENYGPTWTGLLANWGHDSVAIIWEGPFATNYSLTLVNHLVHRS
jgi:hypothetical protein